MLLRPSCNLCRLLMDRELGLEDLKDVHPEVHDSLQKLLVYDGNVEDLGLFFQVTLLFDSAQPWLALFTDCYI